ncbi:MAG: SRPBCC domain-containing protein [Brevibacterium sp.]|nr:SRPBCC domain-containing protein [Brevibacterium sp.]
MPVIETSHNEQDLTLTMVAEFAAPPERVWEVYADPRQLEKVWGPPTYPATVVDHSLVPGGRVTYYMTSPEGEKFHGLWEVSEVEAPSRFVFRDYFAAADFNADESMPGSSSVYTFRGVEGGTQVTYESTFDSLEGLKTVLDMGMVEGATSAMSQIDDLLAEE